MISIGLELVLELYLKDIHCKTSSFMSAFQTMGLAFASASNPRLGACSLVGRLDPSVIRIIFELARAEQHVVSDENSIPIVPVDPRLCTYITSGTPSPFRYNISVGGGVVDGGIVPNGIGHERGVVYFFGLETPDRGRLRVVMCTLGDHEVFLQVGSWMKASEAQPSNVVGAPVYYKDLVYRDQVVEFVKTSARFALPAPFVGSVELILDE